MAFLTSPVPIERTFISTLFAAIDALHQHPHQGLDMAVVVGTVVIAPAHGKVTGISRQTQASLDLPRNQRGGGNILTITHDDGFKTVYMHLSQFFVTVGDEVQIGQPIALSGGAADALGSGDSSGPHLHFEVRDPSGVAQNPLDFLPGQWTLSPNLAKQLGKQFVEGAQSVLAAIATPTNIFFFGLLGLIVWKYWKR